MAKNGEHALVIGASMSGLLAARVLSETYTRVTLLERDELPDSGDPRRGAPQGRHAHGLLANGGRALELLFPGFRDEVVAEGGLRSDLAQRCLWHNFGGVLQAAPSDLDGVLISRPRLENLVRRRVRALPNVTLLDRRDAVGLDHAGGRVGGVRHRMAGTGEAPEFTPADLVVDASGRGGRALYWLEQMGYPLPVEEKVEVDIAYTTRSFRRRPGDLPGRDVVLAAAHPPLWRAGALLAQEGDRWTLTLGGYFGDRAPEDLEGFRAFAQSLPTRAIHDVIAQAEPVGEASVYGFRASLRRRYERLKLYPQGHLVIGDGLASFNPIYGQGMTVAATQALALRRCLAEGERDLARRFFAAAAAVIDTPWRMAVGADLGHRGVTGARSPAVLFVNWYIEKLYKAGQSDARVARAFLDVANLVAPPSALFRPATVARVLRARLGAARVGAQPVAALPV